MPIDKQQVSQQRDELKNKLQTEFTAVGARFIVGESSRNGHDFLVLVQSSPDIDICDQVKKRVQELVPGSQPDVRRGPSVLV